MHKEWVFYKFTTFNILNLYIKVFKNVKEPDVMKRAYVFLNKEFLDFTCIMY